MQPLGANLSASTCQVHRHPVRRAHRRVHALHTSQHMVASIAWCLRSTWPGAVQPTALSRARACIAVVLGAVLCLGPKRSRRAVPATSQFRLLVDTLQGATRSTAGRAMSLVQTRAPPLIKPWHPTASGAPGQQSPQPQCEQQRLKALAIAGASTALVGVGSRVGEGHLGACTPGPHCASTPRPRA